MTNVKALTTKEIRSPNQEEDPKTPMKKSLFHSFGLRASSFVRHSCFVILHLNFDTQRAALGSSVHFATLNVRCSISSVRRSSNLYLRRKSAVMLMPSPGAVTG